jgi:DNA-binding MarR family transcriptional regulator/N-acetylglutamate synthase-like GNAT family acetyltransferase
MVDAAIAARIDAVRGFNRFYTQKIGVLQEKLLESRFSLAEARVIYELGQRQGWTASELGRELGLDAGYLSRMLRGFERQRLISRTRSAADGRRSLISLAKAGRDAFAALDRRSRDEIGLLLGGLSAAEQERLVAAMGSIERLLAAQPPATYRLRPHQPGDMGWVVHRHGVLYAREYGWDESFEALTAEIVAKFIAAYDPACERCWIAEGDGEILGSVFLVKQSPRVAKLRLLLVEPRARGLGLGARLVDECVRFARQCGYRKLTLWTQSVLVAARHIYARAGFRLMREEPHRSFGHDLVGEYWELKL